MTNPPLVPADDIANHQFTLSRRGFDPDEVRAYLTTVADSVRSCAQEVTQLRDQLALGASSSRHENDLGAQVSALQAQVADLGNRLMLSNAVRQEALNRTAELEAAFAGRTPEETITAAVPAQGDDLDRASNELAQVLREAKIRAAHIKADAEREASLLVEQTRRDTERVRGQQQMLGEQAAIRLQERLAELCREAEARVVAANTEAARVLAQADESAARIVDHATFQARRLVANAGSFTAIWVAEADELRSAGAGSPTEVEHPALLSGHSVNDALAAFDQSLTTAPEADAVDEAEEGRDEEGDEVGDSTEPSAAAGRSHLEAVENPADLLDEADQLLSIAEVVRRGDSTGSGRLDPPSQANQR